MKYQKYLKSITSLLVGIVLPLPQIAIASPMYQDYQEAKPTMVVAQAGANSCGEITNPLTPEEEQYARVAWQYFLNNYQEATGFTNSSGGYPSGTLWDMGNYLMALNAARWLNLTDQADFDNRLNKFLASLSGLRLFEDSLPNKVYNAATGELVDYGNNPVERGIGWSALDIGRILAAFHVLRVCHPQYSEWLQSIVDLWAMDRSIQDGYMFGAAVLDDGQTLPVQEGRLGYEEYAARGYQLWGFDVPKALSYEPYKMVEIYGVQVPVDTRRFQETNANNYVVSESYILDGIEFGFLGKQREFAERVFEVQRRRYLATGQLTAVTEDNIDGPPYFLYNTVFSNGEAWATITEKNELYPELRSISTKAALGWRYIFPDSEYAQQLFEVAKGLMSPDGGGFYAGLYEETNEPNKALTGNTNGLIMEILYYKARGNKPLIGGDLVSASTGEPQEYEYAEGFPPPAGVESESAPASPPPETPVAAAPQPPPETQTPPAETPVAAAPPPTTPTPDVAPPPPPETQIPPEKPPFRQSDSAESVVVAPLASVGEIRPSSCNKAVDELTIPERRYAKIAWNYFEANYNPDTGLVSDRSDIKATSLWGIGDYLVALQTATALELISLNKFDRRVRQLLATVKRLPLFAGELPHRGYDIRSLEPVDYGNNPIPDGTGWSGLDVGRLLLALHYLKSCYPQYSDVVDNILLDWSYLRVVRNGQLNNAVVEKDNFDRLLARVHPANRLGYEEYAARGFQLWGFNAATSAVGGDYETKSVAGFAIPVKRSSSKKQSDSNYTVADPFIRYGLELGFDPKMRSLIYPILQAEAKRYQDKKLFTASNTALIQKEPYIIHSTVVGDGEAWSTLTSAGKTEPQHRLVSVAAAFAYSALFPEESYTQKLQQAAVDLYNPALGYYEGFYEDNGQPALGFTSSTNLIVLQSLLYRFRDRQPLLTNKIEVDSPWWKAIATGTSGNGLPQDSEPQLRIVQDESGIYWAGTDSVNVSSLKGNNEQPVNNTAMDSPWWKAIAQEDTGQGLPTTPTQKVNLYVDTTESYWTSLEAVKSQEEIRAKKLQDSQKIVQVASNFNQPLAIIKSNVNFVDKTSTCLAIANPPDINLQIAKQAWQYFAQNWQESTGMVNAVENYPWTTLWDQGSAILGIYSARQLGVISEAEFNRKITKLLATLKKLTIPATGLPNKAYSTTTAQMRQLDNTPDPEGKSGWSALDTARFLLALHVLRVHYPQYEIAIEQIVNRWDLAKLERDGWLYGGIPNKEGKIDYFQEGRLGYEQYAAYAIQLWGIEAKNALYNPPVKDVEIEGVTLQVDLRNRANSNASNYLTNDPYLLWGLELGLSKANKEQIFNLLQSQTKRFERTGTLTAVNEDSLDRPPYFLYYSVYADGTEWNAVNSWGKSFPDLKFLSTKAAFAWNALFPDDSYTKTLKKTVNKLATSDRGFPAGVYENLNLGINKVFNVNTNAIILESLLYQSRNCPLINPYS